MKPFASSVANFFSSLSPRMMSLFLIFCHKQLFQSEKKSLRRSFFFDVCVYFFSPGCLFVSFWFLKKLRLEVTKAPLGRPTVILTIQASRHVYLEDHPQDLLGSTPLVKMSHEIGPFGRGILPRNWGHTY